MTKYPSRLTWKHWNVWFCFELFHVGYMVVHAMSVAIRILKYKIYWRFSGFSDGNLLKDGYFIALYLNELWGHKGLHFARNDAFIKDSNFETNNVLCWKIHDIILGSKVFKHNYNQFPCIMRDDPIAIKPRWGEHYLLGMFACCILSSFRCDSAFHDKVRLR